MTGVTHSPGGKKTTILSPSRRMDLATVWDVWFMVRLEIRVDYWNDEQRELFISSKEMLAMVHARAVPKLLGNF